VTRTSQRVDPRIAGAAGHVGVWAPILGVPESVAWIRDDAARDGIGAAFESLVVDDRTACEGLCSGCTFRSSREPPGGDPPPYVSWMRLGRQPSRRLVVTSDHTAEFEIHVVNADRHIGAHLPVVKPTSSPDGWRKINAWKTSALRLTVTAVVEGTPSTAPLRKEDARSIAR
jgi:hypothetical protein